MKTKLTRFLLAAMALSVLGLQQAAAQGFMPPMMKVESQAFADGAVIPIRYSFHGENVQPDFTISGAPDNTVSYAIIFHDISVAFGGNPNDVTHWVAWNIPSETIAEGSLPEGSVQGANITRQASYMGPGAPSKERFHHYVFEFYALNENLDLASGASRQELLEAMQGKVVGKASYVGRYADARP